MKTPIERLIEELQQLKSDIGKVKPIVYLENIIEDLDRFLPQERQHIIDAYEDARPDESDRTGEDYFNSVYGK